MLPRFGLYQSLDDGSAVLPAGIEGMDVILFCCNGDRIEHGFFKCLGMHEMFHRRKESQHDNVCHHLGAELLGESRSRDMEGFVMHICFAGVNQVCIPDQGAFGTQGFDIFHVGFLAHADQDFRFFHAGEKNFFAADDHLAGTGASPRFRTVILRHGGMLVIIERCRFAQDIACHHNPLAAETGN